MGHIKLDLGQRVEFSATLQRRFKNMGAVKWEPFTHQWLPGVYVGCRVVYDGVAHLGSRNTLGDGEDGWFDRKCAVSHALIAQHASRNPRRVPWDAIREAGHAVQT